MAHSQVNSDIKRTWRQLSTSKSQGKHPQGIKRQRPQRSIRKGMCQNETLYQWKESKDKEIESKHPFPSPSASNTPGGEGPQSSHVLSKATDFLNPPQRSTSNPREKSQQPCYPAGHEINRQLDRKRKRSQEAEHQASQVQKEPIEKRPRTSSASCTVENKEAVNNTDNKKGHPIDHWLKKGHWPKEYFQAGIQSWEDIGADREADRLAEEIQRQEEWDKKQAAKVNNMAHPLLARKRSSASICRQSDELGIEPSSDLPREEKSAKYSSPAYDKELADKGIFMYESDLGITEQSKALCRKLLDSAQSVIQDSLFRDDRFITACQKILNENEAMVLQDISRLIVPSAKNLATCGAIGLNHLVESVNRGWNSAIPITTPRPQPDYSVAFGQSAFTGDQLEKIKPFVGDLVHQPTDFSYLMATWRMYFPFLACEVKCGATSLDIADRQNAHSMTHAVRAVVELYKYAKWEEGFDWKKEVHREILAFSISHDDKAVRIYGHYPVFEDDRTTFYRHPIRGFFLTDLDGRDKWTAYKFTKNVYELWMPKHLERICKAIDALPVGLNFNVSSASLTSVASTENQSELPHSQEMATSAPASQDTERMKKPRLPPKVMMQLEIDRLRAQMAQRDEQFTHLLKQQASSNASPTESELRLRQENDRLREQMAQRDEQMAQRDEQMAQRDEQMAQRDEQMAQRDEQMAQRHTELMDLLKEQREAK